MHKKSNQLILYGDITEDLVDRITFRVAASTNRYLILYDKSSVQIKFFNMPAHYHMVIEDINSIFCSNN